MISSAVAERERRERTRARRDNRYWVTSIETLFEHDDDLALWLELTENGLFFTRNDIFASLPRHSFSTSIIINSVSSDDEFDFGDYHRPRRPFLIRRHNPNRRSPVRERSPVQRVATWQDISPPTSPPFIFYPQAFRSLFQLRNISPIPFRLSPNFNTDVDSDNLDFNIASANITHVSD